MELPVFDSIWATEHYGSACLMQPNPYHGGVYWAGRTTHVDVGTAVIVAPVESCAAGPRDRYARHPTEGPAPAPGLGRGIAPHEYACSAVPTSSRTSTSMKWSRSCGPRMGPSVSRLMATSTKFPQPPSAPRRATKVSSPGRSKRRSRPQPRCAWPPSMAWDSRSSPARTLDAMTAQVRHFNTIRAAHDQLQFDAHEGYSSGLRWGHDAAIHRSSSLIPSIGALPTSQASPAPLHSKAVWSVRSVKSRLKKCGLTKSIVCKACTHKNRVLTQSGAMLYRRFSTLRLRVL